MNPRTIEIVSLAIIALLVALGGKLVLANLATHRPLASIAVVLLIAGAALGLRRAFRESGDDTRVIVTKYVAYLVTAVLMLADILAPAKWIPGSCIAAAEVALVFDMLSIYARLKVDSRRGETP